MRGRVADVAGDRLLAVAIEDARAAGIRSARTPRPTKPRATVRLYGFSTPGQKIDWMRENPRICLETDEWTSHDQWLSVVVFGRYEELPDTPDFAAARAEAEQALRKQASSWEYASIPVAEWRRKPRSFMPIFFRLHIDRLTGHQATRSKPGSSKT